MDRWQTPNDPRPDLQHQHNTNNITSTSTSTSTANWTLSVTLSNWTTNGAGFAPYFWLSPPTSQPGPAVPISPQLPKAGCAAVIYGLRASVNAAGKSDDGDSTKLLDQGLRERAAGAIFGACTERINSDKYHDWRNVLVNPAVVDFAPSGCLENFP
ncbi:hypothetical protein MMC08_002280 [Hypocenomyce scalaris]|nr:hypothetical protein [Hypocenomyce scalaris]